MKNLSVPTVLAVMLVMSHTAAAAEHFSASEYAALSTAAGDNEEVDHNLDGMAPGSDSDMVAPASNAPVTSAPPVQTTPAPTPIVKSIVVKKTDSSTDVPAPKTKAKPAAPARDIPLIDTQNPVESSPDVNYVTGGIGDDERSSIESAKADYNLHVMSASVGGAFVGDARVIISTKGPEPKEMLNVVAGPLLYVKLPAGSYVLNASLGEQKKQQLFTVGKQGAAVNVHLGWKVDAQ